MNLTLLLDLDDTLLATNVDAFTPAYFKALSKHLAPWVKPDDMLPALMAGTQRMLENTDPTCTLEQTFDQEFYPRIGVEKAQLWEAIQDFYDRVFPTLASVTARRPGAVELVDWAVANGVRVAVATDPLLPRKAVEERIRWAGLQPDRFDLISSYETFHFSKSHAEYYAEFLGQLGWPDGPVLMVGNDQERDLARAREFGLDTYQVVPEDVSGSTSVAAMSPASSMAAHGSLMDLRTWLQEIDPATLEPSLNQQRGILAILRSTPAVLHSMSLHLDSAAWRFEPGPDEWALIEIVSHLRDTEREVHHAQLDTLINEAQPFVPRPDAAVWAKQRNYLHDDGPRAIFDFAAARFETLRMLQGVPPEAWNKGARHAIFGPTNFMEVVQFMADHDRLHIQQAVQTLRAPR